MSTNAGHDGAVIEDTDGKSNSSSIFTCPGTTAEMAGPENVGGSEGRSSGGGKKTSKGKAKDKGRSNWASDAEMVVESKEVCNGRRKVVRDDQPGTIRPRAAPTPEKPSPALGQETRPLSRASARRSEPLRNLTVSDIAQDTLSSMATRDRQQGGERKPSSTTAQRHATQDTKSRSPHDAVATESRTMSPSNAGRKPANEELTSQQVYPPPAESTELHTENLRLGSKASDTTMANKLVDGLASLSLKASTAQPSAQSTYVPPHRRQKKHDEVVFRPRGTPASRTATTLHADTLPIQPFSQAEPSDRLSTTSSAAMSDRRQTMSFTRDKDAPAKLARDTPKSSPPRKETNVPSHDLPIHSRGKKSKALARSGTLASLPNTTKIGFGSPAQNIGKSLSGRLPLTSGNLSIGGERTLTNASARYGDFDPVLFNKAYLVKTYPIPSVGSSPVAPQPRRPIPTQAYLDQADLPMKPYIGSPRSLLVVLDLNGTVCYRKRNGPGQWTFKPRPGVSEFLDYLIQNHRVLVWSSARPENVADVCTKLFDVDQLVQLVGVWGRDTLRLSAQEYNAKVQVYKQLSWLWDDPVVAASSIGDDKWGQHNTVLIDDSLLKAASEPHNLIQVEEFDGKVDETKADVLEQVVEYLEMLRMTKDVSMAIKRRPYEYKTNRVY